MKIQGLLEIKSTEVTEKSGTSAKTGKAYSIRSQDAFADVNGEYRRITLNLENNAPAFPVGNYEFICPCYVASFGQLAISRDYKLTPVKGKAA